MRRRLGVNTTWIVTGHQCEFFHAGVFAKLIAAVQLAERAGGTAFFLAVDSDLPKATQLVVPYVEDGFVRQERLPIPACDPRLPIESQPALSKTAWRDFLRRALERSGLSDAALTDYIAGVDALPAEQVSLRDATRAGQDAVLRALGIPPLPTLNLSEFAESHEFRTLLAHVALDARRFANEYNVAQRSYRQHHHVRNPQRPAPLLFENAERTELPYWIYRSGEPRRRLFVSASGRMLNIHADDECIGSDSIDHLTEFENHRQPWPIERAGWRIRPRALMLSAGARLLMGDLFIHGIGGAKYDEMTEDFVRRFWGCESPPIGCVSATLLAELPRFGRTPADLQSANRDLRDMRFNPERHVMQLPAELVRQKEQLVERHRELSAAQPRDRAARRLAFNQIRALNRELYALAIERRRELEQQVAAAAHELDSDRRAREREYFFAQHSRESLGALAKQLHGVLR